MITLSKTFVGNGGASDVAPQVFECLALRPIARGYLPVRASTFIHISETFNNFAKASDEHDVVRAPQSNHGWVTMRCETCPCGYSGAGVDLSRASTFLA